MEPTTLQQAIQYFSDPKNCREYLVARRWPDGNVTCPTCQSANVKFSEKFNRWQCGSHHARRQFTLKTGTIFEDSPIALDKWLTALWMLVNCKNGVSSWEVHRAIGVTQKSAWFMLHRIRTALQETTKVKLGGPGSECEVDETFIGGKARFMHKDRRLRMKVRENNWGKALVMGLLERDGKVAARVIPDRRKDALRKVIEEVIDPGSLVYTDEHVAYPAAVSDEYTHKIVNHLEHYVDGAVHTQGLENFWSLLKRGLGGTYVSVEPFHLFRYVDEQAFRFNNRGNRSKKVSDADRFNLALSQVVGRRLTYEELTGKVGEIAPF